MGHFNVVDSFAFFISSRKEKPLTTFYQNIADVMCPVVSRTIFPLIIIQQAFSKHSIGSIHLNYRSRFCVAMKLLALCLVFGIFGLIAYAFAGIPGGANQITDDGKMKYLLNKVERHLRTLSGKPNHPKFEYVGHSSATIQVVAGTRYQLNGILKLNDQEVNCLMQLWEKPWINFEKFTADCDEEPKRTYESIVGEERRRKRAALLGEVQVIPEEEWPELYRIMHGAFERLYAEHGNMKNYKYKNIIAATVQVMPGNRFEVNVFFEIGESNSERKVWKISKTFHSNVKTSATAATQ